MDSHPDLLVGIATGDNAGVVRLGTDTAIVSTADLMAPLVEDPFIFGQIAAAQTLSHIFATGGAPRSAFSIACWPQGRTSIETLNEILSGAAAKVEEAGAMMVGIHTTSAQELRYGLAVTGILDPRKAIGPAGAQPGDSLLLTKALGTGVVMAAHEHERLNGENYAAAIRSMTQLNRGAAETMLAFRVHAAADIAGSGLAGSALRMAQGGGVSLVFEEFDIPLLPGALEASMAGMVPVASRGNREACGSRVRIGAEVVDSVADLFFDCQTSGGLLIALPESEASALLIELQHGGYLDAAIVGRVASQADSPVEFT